jgi:hypothetical protein
LGLLMGNIGSHTTLPLDGGDSKHEKHPPSDSEALS